MGLTLAKAHAYGNDFLYQEVASLDAVEAPAQSRLLCERHTGIGADGLILYRRTPDGAAMRLFNADGSFSEVSGNGVRGLAALLCWRAGLEGLAVPGTVVVHTDAGAKPLTILEADPPRYVCRAAMGHPTEPERQTLDVGGTPVDAVVFRVGNPQCVVLENELDERRYRAIGPALEHHPAFPEGTNVEFAVVETPERIRILIWERGVGPTLASGTGACAAAVAAAAFGGALRRVEVASPGGVQRVEWLNDGLYLTGWAEVVWEGQWIR